MAVRIARAQQCTRENGRGQPRQSAGVGSQLRQGRLPGSARAGQVAVEAVAGRYFSRLDGE